MLCDDLERWGRENEREAQEGGDMGTCVCIWQIHFVVQQKLTQYCEAIILQKRSLKKTPNIRNHQNQNQQNQKCSKTLA